MYSPLLFLHVVVTNRAWLQPGEVIVVLNAYGINAMCTGTVLEAQERGMPLVGITSSGFADAFAPDVPRIRHLG